MTESRVALVTGAASGIGRAIAPRFGSKGLRGGLGAEVGGPARAPGAVKAVVDGWGRLDVLGNNAGIGHYAPLEKLSEASMREQFEVNVFGPFHFTRAAVPQMRRQKGGQSVNIGSVVGYVGVARGTAYVGPKRALRGMNECWREELYPDGIKVAYVAPGDVITEFGGREEDYSTPPP